MGIRTISRRDAKKMLSLKWLIFHPLLMTKPIFNGWKGSFFAPSELISLGRKQTISQKSEFMHPYFRRRICFRLFIFLVKTSRSKLQSHRQCAPPVEAKKALWSLREYLHRRTSINHILGNIHIFFRLLR